MTYVNYIHPLPLITQSRAMVKIVLRPDINNLFRVHKASNKSDKLNEGDTSLDY